MKIRSLMLFALSCFAAQAGEKTVMHCFAWTPIKTATPAEWDAFAKASDALPQKIKGLTKVWYGKLQSPPGGIYVLDNPDQATTAKLRAGETVSATITRTVREYGMCMEFTSLDALKTYDTDPYHKVWTDAYAKVRVEGTTTYNIIGQ